jgi:hypothetical protein
MDSGSLALVIAALLSARPVPCPKPHRRPAARAAFMRTNPCLGGPDQGSTQRCRGYVVDHVVPLACCGLDAPQNMQWQTRAAAHAKERWELRDCERSLSEGSRAAELPR